MSYEGHIQLLCKKGHQDTHSISYCGDDGISEWRCKSRVYNKLCNEPVGWSNGVDDTNFESHGHREMIELTPQETQVCDLGHTHVLTAATFKPSENAFWYDQKWGWMEMHSIKCSECGDDAIMNICKEDTSRTHIDCCTCYNRKAAESRNHKEFSPEFLNTVRERLDDDIVDFDGTVSQHHPNDGGCDCCEEGETCGCDCHQN